MDNRISNPDQLLTADVDKFCDMFTDLYSNICKPFLDIIIYVYKLTSTLGFEVNVKNMSQVKFENIWNNNFLFRLLL